MTGHVTNFVCLCFFIAATDCLTVDELLQMKCKPGVIEETSNQACKVQTKYDSTYVQIYSNGIPDHQVDVDEWGRNPNEIQNQNATYYVPINPTFADTPSCLPMGTIGLLKNGVALFNPFDVDGRDASVYEDLDGCGGHPQNDGVYHYHYSFTCMGGVDESDGNGVFLGVAMDGFPIYSKRDVEGNIIVDSLLDECRGYTVDGSYRYIISDSFPYAINCLRGSTCSTFGFRAGCRYSIDGAAIDEVICVMRDIPTMGNSISPTEKPTIDKTTSGTLARRHPWVAIIGIAWMAVKQLI